MQHCARQIQVDQLTHQDWMAHRACLTCGLGGVAAAAAGGKVPLHAPPAIACLSHVKVAGFAFGAHVRDDALGGMTDTGWSAHALTVSMHANQAASEALADDECSLPVVYDEVTDIA